jgi:hypothetical protein
VVLVDLVVEAPERFSALKGLLQASAGRDVADALSEIRHVLLPDVGRQRIDRHQVQLIDLDGVLASMPVSLVQNAT